ncbi:WecB/TagA/CpsF family glycosyltransferase [Candidatus Uhrbacteria bacterium]|nr:WecB/TagA/CpsF family glycosyltransferase [Candidatus Uhrbacteria bacterium]
MTHELFGVRIDDEPIDKLTHLFATWLKGDQARVVVTPNAEFILEARKNPAFKALLNKSDLSVADSISLHYAIIALTKNRLEHRYPGVDLLPIICELAEKQKSHVLLLGGDRGSADTSAEVLGNQFKDLSIAGMDPGMIAWNGNTLNISKHLIEQIQKEEPVVIAVGLGQVKQEQFINQIKPQCPSVKIWIGVGGSFEMISGQKKRAPNFFSRIGIEWLWRLFIEPTRWRRIMQAVVIFPIVVALSTLRRRIFLKSTFRVFSEILRHFRTV